MIEILMASAVVGLTGYCIYARFEMRSVRRELGLLKIRTGKLRLDVDETAGHLAKAVEVLSEASTETMKAVIDLRAGK